MAAVGQQGPLPHGFSLSPLVGGSIGMVGTREDVLLNLVMVELLLWLLMMNLLLLLMVKLLWLLLMMVKL
jgi:hypothetical protein